MTGDAPSLDRTTVVMAIRGPYADPILSGRKIWEFRRRPQPGPVTTVVIYLAGDRRRAGLVGMFATTPARCTTPSSLHVDACGRGFRAEEVDPLYGISTVDLATYAGGQDRPVWAIPVADPVPFARTVPLTVFGWARPPQSWRYIPAGWREVVAGWVA